MESRRSEKREKRERERKVEKRNQFIQKAELRLWCTFLATACLCVCITWAEDEGDIDKYTAAKIHRQKKRPKATGGKINTMHNSDYSLNMLTEWSQKIQQSKKKSSLFYAMSVYERERERKRACVCSSRKSGPNRMCPNVSVTWCVNATIEKVIVFTNSVGLWYDFLSLPLSQPCASLACSLFRISFIHVLRICQLVWCFAHVCVCVCLQCKGIYI